jgi:chromosome segregation protein
MLDIETQIKNERETQDRLYREIGKIEGEINANQKTIEKILTDQKSEETKMIPLREVEELERELNGLNEIVAIIDRIKNFILSHKNKIDDRHLVNLQNTNEDLNQQRSVLENQISEAETKSHELANQYHQIKERIEKEKDSSREAEKEIFKISSEQSEIHNKLKILEIETKRIVHLEEEWKREIQEGGVLLGTAILGFENLPLTINDPDFNQNYESDRDEIRKELEKMKIRLEELGGAGGSEVMKEYQETLERDEYLNRELEDLKKSAESLEILIQDLVNRLDIEFKEGIEKINKIFKDFFALMFGGGTAELVLEKIKTKNSKFTEEGFESTDIPSELLSNEKKTVEEGIEIAVSLPRKRIKGLEMLSGGERALTSIALLFAISQVNPPPFIILDETDAALDEANSKKYGDMIESLSKYSQLILITHNRETMSRAGIIYGVTMGRDGVSRLLSIAFDEAVAVAK